MVGRGFMGSLIVRRSPTQRSLPFKVTCATVPSCRPTSGMIGRTVTANPSTRLPPLDAVIFRMQGVIDQVHRAERRALRKLEGGMAIDRDRIRELAAQGMGSRAIARELGCSHSSAGHYLKPKDAEGSEPKNGGASEPKNGNGAFQRKNGNGLLALLDSTWHAMTEEQKERLFIAGAMTLAFPRLPPRSERTDPRNTLNDCAGDRRCSQ
jgi:hypothetical protein